MVMWMTPPVLVAVWRVRALLENHLHPTLAKELSEMLDKLPCRCAGCQAEREEVEESELPF